MNTNAKKIDTSKHMATIKWIQEVCAHLYMAIESQEDGVWSDQLYNDIHEMISRTRYTLLIGFMKREGFIRIERVDGRAKLIAVPVNQWPEPLTVRKG